MTSQLLQDFPELSHLTSVFRFSNPATNLIYLHSREDLEDVLNDPTYFQTIFHSLRQVKELYNGQAELGMANEAIASRFHSLCGNDPCN